MVTFRALVIANNYEFTDFLICTLNLTNTENPLKNDDEDDFDILPLVVDLPFCFRAKEKCKFAFQTHSSN